MREECSMSAAVPYDCQLCGACCAAVPPAAQAYARLFEIDLTRLRGVDVPIYREEQAWTDWKEEVLQLGIKLNHQGKRVCVGFEGDVGGACGCGMFQPRPEAGPQVDARQRPC